MAEYTYMDVKTNIKDVSTIVDFLNKIEEIQSRIQYDNEIYLKQNGELLSISYKKEENLGVEQITLSSDARWMSYEAAIESKHPGFLLLEDIAKKIGNCEVSISSDVLKPHPNANEDGVYTYTTEPTDLTNILTSPTDDRYDIIDSCMIKSYKQKWQKANDNKSVPPQDKIYQKIRKDMLLFSYGGSGIKEWKTSDNNKATTLSYWDASDFRHIYSGHTWEDEEYDNPFGAETIAVTVFENGNLAFSYKNEHSFDGNDKKEKAKSLYDVLNKIQHFEFLKSTLADFINNCNHLSIKPAYFISDQELELLINKLPTLERQLEEARETVTQKHQEAAEFKRQQLETEANIPRAYLNIPYNEKDEAKKLGARWDFKKNNWYCYEEDLDKFKNKWAVAAIVRPQENEIPDSKDNEVEEDEGLEL